MAQVNDPPLLVVGLGASAGGIQALSTFFENVPLDAPIAYVVILHLSPEHESKLAQVLQTATRLPVSQVTEETQIEARHVYVIAPSGTLSVTDGRLTVTAIARLEERRTAVDIFFRTLAERYGSRAAAVILSGTGSNGSSGLRRVKEYGALTIAQLPSDAEYRDMPEHAIATRLVDYILPAADMPRRIADYAERVNRTPDAAVTAGAIDDVEPLREIMRLLRLRTSHDFSNYKPATIRRRVDRRITIRGLKNIAEYAHLLRENPDEATALMKELLISVTNFFRDPDAFAVLERRVIPRLFEDKSGMDQVRVWSAGCATGEEAYSLGMLLIEHASTRPESAAIQIFATELDEEAIAVAREGLYSDADVGDLTPERLRRFFTRDAGGYRVRRELREMVLFAHHNVIKDPPFSHLDLIACRNLLIYLNRTIQDRVIETFHFALRPGGVLFLGASETPDSSADLFAPMDRNAHLYESRSVTARLPLPIVERPLPVTSALPRRPEIRPAERILPGELHLRLLEQFAPPSIIITDEHTIVHMSDRAGRFLQMPGGEPSRDLMNVVHPDLRSELRHALHLATQNRQPVEVTGARMDANGTTTRVDLTVKPALRDSTPPRGYFVILFEQADPAPAPRATIALTSPAASGTEHLDEELARLREQLRITIEQYETQAEEAKASNEELQAMNEELRSAAEELETSKEELQSVNEELTTVNQELKVKIDELGLTNNDFKNLIIATNIGVIFLDKSMRVKLTTPRAQEVFNLLPTDIGRKLSDITSKLVYQNLEDDITKVLDDLKTIDREVPTLDGRWYLLRLVPYRTLDDRIEGVALTFQDITMRHETDEQYRANEERLRSGLEERARERTVQLEAEVRRHASAQEHIRALLGRVVTAQEDERARVARELHDQLGQQLTSLRLTIERLRAQPASAGLEADVDRALGIARELDHAVDFLAWELRPATLDHLGLAVALSHFVDEWSEHYGVTAKFQSAGTVTGLLPPQAEIAFYRIAQEALNNVGKHAHATRVDIVLEVRDSSVVMVLEDDGVGFDVADRQAGEKGFGISSMHERAMLIGGTLDIESSPGRGTTVYLRCPVGAGARESV